MAVPKKRMLSPTIWDDKDFNNLSYPARLLFIGLISIADDDGRGRADVEYLWKTLFGYDKITPKKINKWLESLKKWGKSVKFYTKSGHKYYQLLNWKDYQHIRADRYTPSKIPFFGHTKRQPSGRKDDNQEGTEREHRLDKNSIDKNRGGLGSFYKNYKEILKDKLTFKRK